jgi:hypothetical protein
MAGSGAALGGSKQRRRAATATFCPDTVTICHDLTRRHRVFTFCLFFIRLADVHASFGVPTLNHSEDIAAQIAL